MHYQGPESGDLADVATLNAAFLEYLAGPNGEPLRNALSPPLRPVLTHLADRHRRRLAAVPFLLISCADFDPDYWEQLLRDQPVRDLFAARHDPVGAASELLTATTSFLWQLARRNPYATRLLSGASPQWCERVAALSLLQILPRVTGHADLLLPRLAGNEALWRQLLGAGVSAEVDIRRAAHLGAMQTVLATTVANAAQPQQSAACYSAVPVRSRSTPGR